MTNKIKPPFNREYLLEKIAERLTDDASMETLLRRHYENAYSFYDRLTDDELIAVSKKILFNQN